VIENRKHDIADDHLDNEDDFSGFSEELEVTDDSVDGAAPDTFHEEINLAISIAYPELLNRVRRIRVADWHRKQSAEIELANTAVIAAIRSIRKSRAIPDDLVGYLVTIASNLATKDWKKRERDRPADPASLSTEATEWGTGGETASDDGDVAEPADLAENADLDRTLLDLEDQESQSQGSPSAQHLALTAAIDQLASRQRQVLMLYADRGSSCTQKALAEEIGITEKNFQMTLTRAGKSVCKFLKESGFEVSDAPAWAVVGYETPRK